MRGSPWAKFLRRFLIASCASGLALSIAATAGLRYQLKQEERTRAHQKSARLERVQAVSHSLASGFSADLEQVRGRALALRQTLSGALPEEGGILHWAELDADNLKISGVRRTLQRPGTLTPALEKYYLDAATARLDSELPAIRTRKIAILRLENPQAPSHERLVLAFPVAEPEKNLVLAVIDPERALPSIREAAEAAGRTDGSRAYLTGRDGVVLVHSDPNYRGSSFAGGEILTRADRLETVGEEGATLSQVKASDGLLVTARVMKPYGLPWWLVAEIPMPLTAPLNWLGLSPREQIYLRWIGLGALGLAFCVLASLLFAWVFTRKPEAPKLAARPKAAPLAPEPDSLPLADSGPWRPDQFPEAFEAALVETALHEELGALDRGAARALTPAPEEQAPAPQGPAPQAPAPEPAPEPDPRIAAAQAAQRAQAQAEERARLAALAAEEARAEAARELARLAELERQNRFLEERLLDSYEEALVRERDPKKIGHQLTEFANRLFAAPTAFFAFHSGLRSAILMNACGLPANSNRLVSFPLSDSCLSSIVQAEREGRVATLEGYLPIADLLKLNYRVRDFQAWALTGLSSGRGLRLLGVLVVLAPPQASQAKGPGAPEPGDEAGQTGQDDEASRARLICQILRSTAPVYEKKLQGSEAEQAPG